MRLNKVEAPCKCQPRVVEEGAEGASDCGHAAKPVLAAHGEAAAVQEVSCNVIPPPLAEAEALLSLHAACRSAPLDGMGSSSGTPDFRPINMGSSRWAVTTARGCCPPEAAVVGHEPPQASRGGGGI